MPRLPVLLLGLVTACTTAHETTPARANADSLTTARLDSIARVRQDSINRAQPGYIVDSIRPIAEEVRRFAAAVGGAPVTMLADGAPSRDALVHAFATAVSARDTAALHALALTPREFIDLVYPESPYPNPPYRQPPGLLWQQIQLPSGTGSRRALERLGGRPLRISRLSCPLPPEVQGHNRLHANCVVTFVSGEDAPREGRLFGSIVERGGRFKFVSFANMY